MPLIVEDGTGKPDADSWVSEPDTTTYWTERQVDDWIAASPTRREAALRNAADYLSIAYRWPGQPISLEQRLPWPRAGVRSGRGFFPSDSIPAQIINAQMVLAVEDLAAPLLRKPAPAAPQVIEESRGVRGMNKTVKFATAPVDKVSGLARFPVVDQILSGVALSGTSGDFASVPLRKGL